MKTKTHFTRSALSVALASVIALTMAFTVSYGGFNANAESTTAVTEQDVVKLAEGLDLSTDSETYDMGTRSYRIFDISNSDFSSLFVSSNITESKNYSFTGSSRADISSQYGSSRSISSGNKINISSVSANIDVNFQTSISSSLETINEEYFEYYERYQQTRVITTDWLSHDLTNYFSSAFINDLQNVSSLGSAVSFLEKYGTHVFDRYYLGGSLIITNYVVSEVSISEEYSSSNKSLGLFAQISSAISSNNSGSDYSIEGNNVNTTQTKSQMNMRARGGMNFNALTVDDLFTYNQEYASNNGSGYVYKEWINSLDENQNEVVINADNAVAVWDLIKASSYYNEDTYSLLQEAFDVMSLSNYSELCNENGINSEIIGQVSYSNNGLNVEFDISSDSISLPSGTAATFTFGSTITELFNTSDFSIALAKTYSYARLSSGRLVIDSGSGGKTVELYVKYNDLTIYSLDIEIVDNSTAYASGYGTKDQPYLISTADQWTAFVNSSSSFDSKTYYKLMNDIDLKGKNYNVGGNSGRVAFKGELDGDGYTLSNFSVIATSEWEYVGIFGINMGTICNLALDNVKCMNSGIISASNGEVSVGILAGDNQGTLSNIKIENSSVRVTGQLSNSEMNIGVICGDNSGAVSYSGVSDCNVFGITWKGSGSLNVGGLIGCVESGSIAATVTDCYARNTKINAYNKESTAAGYYAGGIIGKVVSNTINNNDGTTENIISLVSMCVAYGNTFGLNTSSSTKAFGRIAGYSTANNSFENCYYEYTAEQAVNSGSMNGCTMLRTLSLSNIGNSEFYIDWTTDAYGVVLKLHV